jgi:hypothetical protein
MFGVSLLDHLRMTFGHVVFRHKAHLQLARSRAYWSRWFRAAEAALMIGVTVAATGAAFGKEHIYVIVSAVLAVLALTILLLHLTFDMDRSAQAHASCATRLWQIREQYRAVLSDFSDGALDLDAVRLRRDELMDELRGVYETAPLADGQTYSTAGRGMATADEVALTDEEIDMFLPKSLHKTDKPTAA